MPVVLAALAGYSDLAYRRICRRFGARFCTTEVMLDKCLLAGPKLRKRLARTADDDHPIAGQIMGSDPRQMAQAAAHLAEAGFDVIDLNFACPVRKALRRRRGGYLMKQPERVVEIVRAVTAAVDRPVMLKLRRSFDEADTSCEALWHICDGAFDAGAAAVCLHARSVQALYAGPADWDTLVRARQRYADRTIIGSGDILTPADALRMLEETGVDAVAAARGAMGNPWFFRQVGDLAAGREPCPPPLAEQAEVLREHFAAACELYGPRRGPKIMRKFGIKYARIHPRPKEARMAFVEVKSPAGWQAVLDRLYADA